MATNGPSTQLNSINLYYSNCQTQTAVTVSILCIKEVANKL